VVGLEERYPAIRMTVGGSLGHFQVISDRRQAAQANRDPDHPSSKVASRSPSS